MKQVLELRPVYHRREDRIRAHVVLCWLALLLVRVAENTCEDTWPNLRRELEKLQLGSFSGPAGSFRQRTELTVSAVKQSCRSAYDETCRLRAGAYEFSEVPDFS
jgi:transposase